MRTLGDAWTWYEHNRSLLRMIDRLGERYWAELPWEGSLGNDDEFRLSEGEQVSGMARGVLKEFDDLAIFVLFSVFEAVVRATVAEDLQPEVGGLRHPALQRVATAMLQEVAEGSFHRHVLELFKQDGKDPASRPVNALIEEVNRIRRYRNWVAHGRKVAERPSPIRPKNAHATLQSFLLLIVTPGEATL